MLRTECEFLEKHNFVVTLVLHWWTFILTLNQYMNIVSSRCSILSIAVLYVCYKGLRV